MGSRLLFQCWLLRISIGRARLKGKLHPSVRISPGNHRPEAGPGVWGGRCFSPQNDACQVHGLELSLLMLDTAQDTLTVTPGWRKPSGNLLHQFPGSLHFFLKNTVIRCDSHSR